MTNISVAGMDQTIQRAMGDTNVFARTDVEDVGFDIQKRRSLEFDFITIIRQGSHVTSLPIVGNEDNGDTRGLQLLDDRLQSTSIFIATDAIHFIHDQDLCSMQSTPSSVWDSYVFVDALSRPGQVRRI